MGWNTRILMCLTCWTRSSIHRASFKVGVRPRSRPPCTYYCLTLEDTQRLATPWAQVPSAWSIHKVLHRPTKGFSTHGQFVPGYIISGEVATWQFWILSVLPRLGILIFAMMNSGSDSQVGWWGLQVLSWRPWENFCLPQWLEGPHSAESRDAARSTWWILRCKNHLHPTRLLKVLLKLPESKIILYMRHCPSTILFAILLRAVRHCRKIGSVTAIQSAASEFCYNTSVYTSFSYCQSQGNSTHECEGLTTFSTVTVLGHLSTWSNIYYLIVNYSFYFLFILQLGLETDSFWSVHSVRLSMNF